MFHFPAFPPYTLCIQVQVTPHDWCQVPPFGHPGITARLTAPPGLSRPPTSFIGSWCQGIHRPPLTTYTNTNHGRSVQKHMTKTMVTHHRKQDARVHYTILNPQPTHNPNHEHQTQDTTPHRDSTQRYARQIMPGTKATTTTTHGHGLFLQDPTGCSSPTTSRTTTPLSHPPPGKLYSGQRWPLPTIDSPVSPPMSTPPPHSGGAGHCPLSRKVAP